MPAWQLDGEVFTGLGLAARLTALDWVRARLAGDFGIDPYPGTLNLTLTTEGDVAEWIGVLDRQGTILESPGDGYCNSIVLPVRAGRAVPAVVLVPQMPGYPKHSIEVIAAVNLRHHFGLCDGQRLELSSADLPGIDTVIFDVDGTLVDSIAGIHLAAGRAAALFGYQVPRDAVRRALDGGEALWSLIMPHHLRDDLELMRLLREETMRHWPRVLEDSVDVFPGIEDTLLRLSTAGIRLGIVTGSRGESFLPLQRRNLMRHFEIIVTAGDVSRPKPDPEGLLRCLDDMTSSPGRAVYVGDTRADIAAGRAAGMRTIGVLSGASDSPALSAAGADRIVSSHASLPETLLPRPPFAGSSS